MSAERFSVPEKQAIRKVDAPLKAPTLLSRNPQRLGKELLTVDSIPANRLERNGADAEAQQAARDAIMEIPLFPDLTVALRGALGYGPHVDMLQHFCYWMHPRHPKMQNRWTLYKTYAEWREECGLARKQIDKGRTKLRELGLVTEKKGPHGRLHYRVDWLALAEVLSLSPLGEQTDELNDWFDDFDLIVDLIDDEDSLSPVGEQGQNVPQGEQGSLSPIGGQPNTGKYAGDYLQENTLLQRAPEPAFAEPGAPEINRDKEQKEGIEAPPSTDKRHSQVAEPPKPKIAKEVEIKVWALIFGLPDETDVTRFADRHIADEVDADGEAFTVERVAEKVREHLGRDDPLEAYVPFVQRCLDDRRAEGVQAEAAS